MDIRWTKEEKSQLSSYYTDVMPHIALERADLNEDWDTFRYILQKDKLMLSHLEIVSEVFDMNFNKLTKDVKNKIFKPL